MMDPVSTQNETLPITDPTADPVADVDEPPERIARSQWIPQWQTVFAKADPKTFNRRESLLTRQLHYETEHTDDDDHTGAPTRALSTQSTWSNPSVASPAELTSDDGHSVASPAVSPPLPPTAIRTTIPVTEKTLSKEPEILGHEGRIEVPSEKLVEAGLGRKRCISFACGNKTKTPPIPQTARDATSPSSKSPPKRKCMLKFICPTRLSTDTRASTKPVTDPKRQRSPPPPERKTSSRPESNKPHRGSDSTITHVSPRSVRKGPIIIPVAQSTTTASDSPLPQRRRMSNDSNCSTEATRFHEFASSEGEPEEWVQEATCHRSRLTVSDTLQKENILRKACEEAEAEEVQEEEDDEDMDDDMLDPDDDEGLEQEDLDEEEEEEESDDGFHTDDEEGFADSDPEGEESDEEWWIPGGPSNAATSVDHLERLNFSTREEVVLSSSVGSVSSANRRPPPRSAPAKVHRKRPTGAMAIRRESHELPDSTDFVCGTLDEDRPLEQAFLNHLKQKEAAKHKARPQDIDPTFPTSDPEMDEEDDEDLEDAANSERDDLMHGELDELDGDYTARRRGSLRPRSRSGTNRSPPPSAAIRRKSPAPAVLKKQGTARSPPPPKRLAARSPPPPKRAPARSPPPRKLFGQSPLRNRSPAPTKRLPSPPNTRRLSRLSPVTMTDGIQGSQHVLASRPQLTHTASLPRGGYMLSQLNKLRDEDDDGSDTAGNNAAGERTKRGAIDIYKGLEEKRRQRRKEKLYQKAAAKAAAKGEKAFRVKPGKGAQRMRELGMELHRYHGKGGHILSL